MSASLVGSEMCIRDSSGAEVHQGRLIVSLEQDLVAVPQSPGAGHGLIHRALAQVPLAQDRARQNGTGVT
eukprot:10561684-Alexandrium_andersonii.AAC.1